MRIRILALSLAAASLAACSGSPPAPPVDTRSVVNPARSDRGNPPYYDVLGRRYYVLTSSEGYRERGVASWYGRDFHGRPTSSGEIYDMNALTAAHKTLPIPTWVEVTNLTNGQRVIVKVNDRGPFVDNRIIDLSQRAAESIGMINAGTARVQVRALGVPEAGPPATRLASTSPPPATSGSGFSIIREAEAAPVGPNDQPLRAVYVQVGAFSDRNNAADLVERLEDAGFDNSFILTLGQGRGRLHRVRIGPLETARDFDRIRADLRAAGIHDSSLVTDN